MLSMKRVAATLVIMVLVPGSMLFAQTGTGEVNGTVSDPSGASVPGATVRLVSQGTSIEDRVTTSGSGTFTFLHVKPGSYVLSVEAKGFKKVALSPFDVGVSQVVTQDVALALGEVTQVVEVTSTAPLLQSSSTELGTVITEKAVNELPLNGRNFTELLLLSPGITPINVSQGGSPGNPDGGIVAIPSATVFKPSFHGSQNRSVVYYQDGIINTDFRGNVPGVQPNIDLMQEFKVVSHDTHADVGGVIGGVVNIVSKSGTNNFHGSGFEFVRNDAFDARNTFTDANRTSPAPFRQNQFGATVGGPIKRNRTFFYAGYNAWRYSKPSQSLFRVPTSDELNGNFSANPFKDVLPIYNPYSTRPDPAKPGSFLRDRFMCDATGNPLPTNSNGTQVAGTPCNIVPPSLISPAMQNLLQAYLDSPNLTGDPSHNFIESLATTDNENDVQVRIDNRFSEKDNVFFRFAYMWHNSISASTPKSFSSAPYHYHNEGGGWVHTFRPNLILDVRGGNLSGPVDNNSLSRLGTAPESKYFNDIDKWAGLNVGLASPFTGPQGGGFTPNQDNFRNNPGWNVTANLNWIKGKHNLATGYAYNRTSRIQINHFESFSFSNDITSNPQSPGSTGNSLASALLGFPVNFSGQLPALSEVHLDNPEWALYVQDEWKVRQKVTVNWGLRWDVDPRATIVGNRVSDAVDLFHQKYIVGLGAFPPLCSQGGANPCLPIALSSIPFNDHIVLGGRQLLVPKPEYDQFGPRIGIAWQVTPTTVVRGGYGLYYDALIARTQTAQNDLEQLAWPYTPGFSGASNVPTSAGVPAGGAGNPLVPITNLEGSFPSPVPAPTPWTPSGWADDPNSRDPRSSEWNIEVQRQVTQNLLLSVAYVGSKSGRLAYTGPNANAATQPSPNGTPLTTIDSLRAMPFLEGAPLYFTQTTGRANYHAFELKAVHKFSQGLQSQLSFTWSKSMDNSSGYYDVENGAGGPGVQNFFDQKSNYSVSGFDLPKYLSWFTVWELPFGRGKRWLQSGAGSWILGNWQVNSILQARSGQAYTLGIKGGGDVANIFGTDVAGVRAYARPNLVGNPFSGVAPQHLFNPAAYSIPTASFGNVGRNTLRSPGVFNTDFSFFKNIPLGQGEGREIQLRFESFNLFNNVNWSTSSDTNIGDAGAGIVTGLAAGTQPRQLQFGIRIIF